MLWLIFTLGVIQRTTKRKQKKKMAVKTKKYRSKLYTNREVRAIKVTEKNYVSVAEWCGGEAVQKVSKVPVEGNFDVSDHRVRVRTPRGIRVARVGEFVFKDAAPFFWVGKDEFEKEYQLA